MTFFTPYIEAYQPRSQQPDSFESGSNTSQIDAFRQGIEITTARQRYAGLLPKLRSSNLEIVTYGQSSEFRAETKFEEIIPFNPITFINDQDALMFPILLGNTAALDPERFGGYIEPLSRGTRDLLLSTTEFQPNDVRGMVMGGNEDAFRKSSYIVEAIRKDYRNSADDLYIDASSNLGTSGGSISLPGYFPESEKLITPFNDGVVINRSLTVSMLPTGSAELLEALSAMLGSTESYASSELLLYGSTGHLADDDSHVVDSIAFRGLLR